MKYFRAFAQFETARSEDWVRERITDTITSMTYKPDEKRAQKNAPTSDLFFKPKTGFRMYTNSFEPLMHISTENTSTGSRVTMRFELPKAITIFLLFSMVFVAVVFPVLAAGRDMQLTLVPLVYVPFAFLLTATVFRLTSRYVLRRVSESLEVYEKVSLQIGDLE